MTDTTEIAVSETTAQDLMDRYSAEHLLPGESAADKGQLRAALLAEFAPKTALEARLADDLVEYEWEILRHRSLRDAACPRRVSRDCVECSRQGRAEFHRTSRDLTEEDNTLLYELVCETPTRRRRPRRCFSSEPSWEPRHLLGMAVGISRRRRHMKSGSSISSAAAVRS